MAEEKKKRGKFLKEFKEFIMRGNIIDLAIGIIIGGAFQKIVTSLVNDILMPLISAAIKHDIKTAQWVVKEGTQGADSTVVGAIIVRYGAFIQSIIDFLIIGLTLFVIIKVMMKVGDRMKERRAQLEAKLGIEKETEEKAE